MIRFRGGERSLEEVYPKLMLFLLTTPSVFVKYEARLSKLSSPSYQILLFVTDLFQNCEIWAEASSYIRFQNKVSIRKIPIYRMTFIQVTLYLGRSNILHYLIK